MVKLRFDFTKNPPQIDLNRDRISKSDIPLLQTVFYQMSFGKKFLKKFILEISGKDVNIIPETEEKVVDLKIPQKVFKNLSKDAGLAFRDFS